MVLLYRCVEFYKNICFLICILLTYFQLSALIDNQQLSTLIADFHFLFQEVNIEIDLRDILCKCGIGERSHLCMGIIKLYHSSPRPYLGYRSLATCIGM